MDSPIGAPIVPDGAFIHVLRMYQALKYLLDKAPGGESVQLPPITLDPMPDRQYWIRDVLHMVKCWVAITASYSASPEYEAFEKGFKAHSDRLVKDWEVERLKASNKKAKSATEALEILSRQAKILEQREELRVNQNDLVEEAHKKAVVALEEEMQKWRKDQFKCMFEYDHVCGEFCRIVAVGDD